MKATWKRCCAVWPEGLLQGAVHTCENDAGHEIPHGVTLPGGARVGWVNRATTSVSLADYHAEQEAHDHDEAIRELVAALRIRIECGGTEMHDAAATLSTLVAHLAPRADAEAVLRTSERVRRDTQWMLDWITNIEESFC